MKNKTLIALATAWGPHHGGINSFNFDFLKALGVALHQCVRVFCVVPKADEKEKTDARRSFVELIGLPNPPTGERLEASHAAEIVRHLREVGAIAEGIVWLGHDLFTGGAAVEAAKQTETRSAVIHHMSYAAYEGFKSGSGQKTKAKVDQQRGIFNQAHVRVAVGPLLQDELRDLLHGSDVSMLIPGLPEIEPKEPPKRFMAVMFGRLDPESDRIKQGQLGVAAFASAYKKALENSGLPQSLRDRPRLKMYGVNPDNETEIRAFANGQAGAALDLHALPFDTDRPMLFGELAYSSVALMPSWHEGFGLVGWEAIGAGVPLILSKTSGLYRFLEKELAGAGTGCVHGVDVRGREAEEPPFFQDADVDALADKMIAIAGTLDQAKRSALQLRALLGKYTWKNCAEQFASAVGWDIPDDTSPIPPAPTTPTPQPPTNSVSESFITVPSPVWKSGQGSPDSLLLRAEEACVPFHPDREGLLDAILRWTDAPEFPVGVRLHIGSGGSGKTRLLLEACHRLDSSWFRGFLDSGLAPAEIKKRFAILLKQQDKVFVVLDYAETRRAELAALVESALPLTGKQVRIVLLARDAGEWWDRLPVDFPKFEQLFGGRATCGPYCLPDLHANASTRNAAYVNALHAFGERLGIDPARRIPEILPDLSAEHYASPLYLQMAALLSFRGERAETATGLTDALLRHEERYWKRLAESHGIPDGERAIGHLLILTTMAGGLLTARDSEKRYVTSEGPRLSGNDFNRLFHSLRRLYPDRQGLQPLRPDLLGEALAARAFNSAGDGGTAWLDSVLGKSADRDAKRHALTVLTRLIKHRPAMEPLLVEGLSAHFPACVAEIVEVGLETGEPLARAAVEAFNRLPMGKQSQVAGLLMRLLPDQTIRLGELALRVAEFKSEQAKKAYLHRKTSQNIQEYIWALNAQGLRSEELGKLVESEGIFLEAERLLDIHQADQSLREIKGTIAASFSVVLSGLGRHEDALILAQKALSIFHKLAIINPAGFNDSLAISLGNTANRLGENGQYEDALAHALQAFELYKKLSLTQPEKFQPDLARTYLNLAVHFGNLGQLEKALDNEEDALLLIRQLAEKRPDRFEPELAIVLNNISNHMGALGRNEDALQYAKHALALNTKLAETRPDRFEKQLVKSLVSVSQHLSKLSHFQKALDYSNQALNLCRCLANADQNQFEESLAACLYGVGNRLADLGYYDEAIGYANEALALCEKLANIRPERYESNLALANHSIGNRLVELGHYKEALKHAKKAQAIYEKLAITCPARDTISWLESSLSYLHFAWLDDQLFPQPIELPVTEERLAHVLGYIRPLLEAHQASVFSCINQDLAGAKKVIEIYDSLPVHQRHHLDYAYTIATLYLNHYQPTSETRERAEAAFHDYSKPRQGRFPRDFLDTLKRLDVDLTPFLSKQNPVT